MDFLKNIKINFIPPPILNDDPQSADVVSNLGSESTVQDDITLIQNLVDHLNEMANWKDRVDALNYLGDLAEKEANNPEFFSNDPSMINAITSIGGQDNGRVDLNLIKTCISLVLEWHEWAALNSLSGGAATNA